MMRRLAHSSLHIIAVSRYTKARLSHFFGLHEDKISVVYHGIDEAFFNVTPSAVQESVNSLRLPSPRYLLYLGSLEPRKNLGRLLDAWSRIVSKLPSDLWLVIAGGGDRAIYQGRGFGVLPKRAHLTGYIPDRQLHGLYAGSVALLYPSLAEGFGFPPLEAMAAGVPVITSNTSALPEVCEDCALYVDPLDVDHIARTVLTLVTEDSLRARLAEAGPSHARKFTWERSASQTLKILECQSRICQSFETQTTIPYKDKEQSHEARK